MFSLVFALSAVPASAQTTSPIMAYANVMRKINPRLAQWESRFFASEVVKDARKVKLDPRFVMAIVTVESHWNARAVSRVGALGLGQLMPETARSLHVDPHSPRSNLVGTSRYLSTLVKKFKGSQNQYRYAIAGYNAGPLAVVRYGGIPPYAETQQYVTRVLRVWQQLKSRLGAPIVIADKRTSKKLKIVPEYWYPGQDVAPASALAEHAQTPAAAPGPVIPAETPAVTPATAPAAESTVPQGPTDASISAQPAPVSAN